MGGGPGGGSSLQLSIISADYGLLSGRNAAMVAALQDKLPALRGAVVLCDDISCGVVPLEAEERAWREATGRCLLLLTGEAQRVVRLFCGLESVLK